MFSRKFLPEEPEVDAAIIQALIAHTEELAAGPTERAASCCLCKDMWLMVAVTAVFWQLISTKTGL